MRGLSRMILGILLAAAGCEVSRGPLTLMTDDPAVKLPAMKRSAVQNRQQDIPALVESLDDTDPAVRMFAIGTLQKLTNETYGYRFFDAEVVREPSVQQWRERAGLPAIRPGTPVISVTPGSTPAMTPSTGPTTMPATMPAAGPTTMSGIIQTPQGTLRVRG